MPQQKLVIDLSTGVSEYVDLTAEEIEAASQHKAARAEVEALETADLRQFQSDWYALHADNPSHEVIVRLLRRLLPHKPE